MCFPKNSIHFLTGKKKVSLTPKKKKKKSNQKIQMSSDRSDDHEDNRRRRRLGGGYNAPEEPQNTAKSNNNKKDDHQDQRSKKRQQQQEQFMNAIPNIVVRVDDDDDEDDVDGGRRRRRRLEDEVIPTTNNNSNINHTRSNINNTNNNANTNSNNNFQQHQNNNNNNVINQHTPYDVNNYSNTMSSISLLPLPAEQLHQEKTLAALSMRKNRFGSSTTTNTTTTSTSGKDTSSSSTIPAIGVHGLAETRNLLFSKIDFIVTKEHLLSIIGTLLGEERMKSNPVLNIKRKEIELTIENDPSQTLLTTDETLTAKQRKEKMTFVRNTEQVELEFLKVRDAVIVHNAMNGGIINGRKISVEYI